MTTELDDWLYDTGSITKRLVKTCQPDAFKVRVLSQRWSRPAMTEAEAMQVPRHQWAFIRDVLLCCGNRPWLYAQTLIPVSSLTGANRRLLHLRNKPLGAALFADPTLQRCPIQKTILTMKTISPWLLNELPEEFNRAQEIIGRQSIFLLRQKPVMVREYFLSSFIHDALPG